MKRAVELERGVKDVRDVGVGVLEGGVELGGGAVEVCAGVGEGGGGVFEICAGVEEDGVGVFEICAGVEETGGVETGGGGVEELVIAACVELAGAVPPLFPSL